MEALRSSPAVWPVVLVIVAATGAAIVLGAESEQGTRAPVRAPLFTEAQSRHGQTVYASECASCHGATLTGGAAPALSGAAFERSWGDPRVTLDDLFFIIRTTMPPRDAGNLTDADRAAVFAHILKSNGYAAGPTALATDMPQLRQQRLEVTAAPRPAARPEPPAFIPGAAGAAPGSTGPDQTALNASNDSGDWLLHNHDYAGTRFSPLNEITPDNAARLTPACMYQMGERDNFQTGPIVHDGVMYVTTMTSTVALDAATCRMKWRHRWEPKDSMAWERNRGVVVKDGRVIRATPDGYLLALNADRGALLWARQVAKPDDGETFTMAPLVFEDLVLIGPAGSENNMQGWVGAFRASDGSPVWRFNTVPKPGEPGYETWKNPRKIPVGGGAVWTSFSLDVASGELHIAVTNPAPDLPIHLRQGENLYTNSIVAVDVRTGKLQWYRQLIANDSHDWDVTHATPLFTATVEGRLAPAGGDRREGRDAARDRSRFQAAGLRDGDHDA